MKLDLICAKSTKIILGDRAALVSVEKADLVNLETFLVYLTVENPDSLQSAFSTDMNVRLFKKKDISVEMIKKGEINRKSHNLINTSISFLFNGLKFD